MLPELPELPSSLLPRKSDSAFVKSAFICLSPTIEQSEYILDTKPFSPSRTSVSSLAAFPVLSVLPALPRHPSNRLNIAVPALESYTGRRVVSDSFCGTTWSSSGFSWVKPDSIEIFVDAPEGLKITSYPEGSPVEGQLYDESKLAVKDKYSMFMGGNCPLHEIVTGNEGPSLLIIRDSYTDSLIPFLLEDFSEIHATSRSMISITSSSPTAWTPSRAIRISSSWATES